MQLILMKNIHKKKRFSKNFIQSYLDEDTDEILKKAEEIESSSNQLLNYTNILKKFYGYQKI